MNENARAYVEDANAIAAGIARAEAAHRRKVASQRKRQRAALLRANRAGATYDELVAECSISDGQLAKVIRQAKREAPTTIAARPPHKPADRALRQRRSTVG